MSNVLWCPKNMTSFFVIVCLVFSLSQPLFSMLGKLGLDKEHDEKVLRQIGW